MDPVYLLYLFFFDIRSVLADFSDILQYFKLNIDHWQPPLRGWSAGGLDLNHGFGTDFFLSCLLLFP